MTNRKNNIKTVKARKIARTIYIILATVLVTAIGTGLFFERYKVQTPILIQLRAPVVKRELISPVIDEVEAVSTPSKVVNSNDGKGNTEVLPGEDKVEPTKADTQRDKKWGDYSIKEKIELVFEADTNKAMLLLQGRGKDTCAENRKLAPDAINTNIDGSQDFGIFQINTNWHGYNRQQNNKRYLLDEDVNIAMAKRLFDVSGGSFKLWSCGKAYGI